eukprot:CAMPEP_0115584632 /NCGR_PEP_ID=MMETSP0272-20121206/6784_1 /TAXON_ID=71861 /ORGANISM="Scrippsiella trochoidea, Strain CCMP3099" /LENGTH=33 /DNA_ID= /DNA_START= /DNA_END= /DNA_ORIENTATION=
MDESTARWGAMVPALAITLLKQGAHAITCLNGR